MGDTSLSAMASCEYTVTESFFRSIRSCSTYIYISISSCGYFFGLSKRSNSDHLKFSIHAVLVGPVENECLFMLSSVFMFPQ